MVGALLDDATLVMVVPVHDEHKVGLRQYVQLVGDEDSGSVSEWST